MIPKDTFPISNRVSPQRRVRALVVPVRRARAPVESVRRALAHAVLACAAAGALLAGCSDAPAAGGGGGGFVFRIPVTAVRAEPGDVSESIEIVGDVVSRRWAVLAFERPGRVTEVRADLGDVVAEGAVLAGLDQAVPKQEMALAEAALLAAQADEAYAVSEAQRGAAAGANLLSASETGRRDSVAAVARARTVQFEADVGRFKELLAQCELRAPFDGTIVARDVTDGSYAQTGAPAFTLVDLARREVWLEIPAVMAADLKSGAVVQLRSDDLPDVQVTAVLDELLPAANPAARTFKGVVRLEPEADGGRLMPGLFVRARMERRHARSETVVPTDSVLLGEHGHFIAVMDPPKTATDAAAAGNSPAGAPPPSPTGRIVPVRVLASDGVRSAIESAEPGALRSGDMVVVIGAENVFPGAPLAPAQATSAQAGESESAAAAAGASGR